MAVLANFAIIIPDNSVRTQESSVVANHKENTGPRKTQRTRKAPNSLVMFLLCSLCSLCSRPLRFLRTNNMFNICVYLRSSVDMFFSDSDCQIKFQTAQFRRHKKSPGKPGLQLLLLLYVFISYE